MIPLQHVGADERRQNGSGVGADGDPCYTLDGQSRHGIFFDPTQITSPGNYSEPKEGDPCHPLAAGSRGPAVAFTERTREQGRTFEAQEDLAYALTNPGSGGRTHSRQLYDGAGVRRLTPLECERLQGFPDGWTEGESDAARYRMLGNAVCVPVAEWIAKRIAGDILGA